MNWDDRCQAYLTARQTSRDITELEKKIKGLAHEVVEAFTQLTEDDEQWFTDALVDSERKWFVVFVLYESLQVPDFLFQPLLRAAVYEVNPSLNRSFIEPALVGFGWRKVIERLLQYVEQGTDFDKAGAVNALYWAAIPYVHWGENEVKTTEDIAALKVQKRNLFLKEFVQNSDVHVRRSIIPQLDLDQNSYSSEYTALVPKAIEVAQTHPDDYIRHRLQVQLGEASVYKPLPYRDQG